MWTTKLLAEQSWSFGHVLAGLVIYTTSFKDDMHDLSVADPFDDPKLQPCKKLC
jgi:hypothetical protein